jgi:hypothetical protein
VVISGANATIESEIATVAALLRNDTVCNSRTVYRILWEPALGANGLVFAERARLPHENNLRHLSGMTAGGCIAIIGGPSFEQEENT